MKNLITIFLLFVITISFAQEIKKRKVTSDQIDAVFSKWNTTNKPGIAVGILNNGKIEYVKGFGLANLEHQVSITKDTKFYIGDLAKEFTVYSLLMLEEKGKLSFNDNIKKYIPYLPFSNLITIKQLVQHTAGLNNNEVLKALLGFKSEDVFTKEEVYKAIEHQVKHLPISKIQNPTDVGFMILEDIISNIVKMSYTDFVTKEIFKPLGMVNTVFDTKGLVIKNKAEGYFPVKEGYINSTLNYKQTILSDLYTTVEDMCLWAKELRNPKIANKNILTKFDDLSIVNGEKLKEVNRSLYTGGHRFWNFKETRKLYHTEVAEGYACKFIRYPDYDLSVVIMGNDGVYNGSYGTSTCALYIKDFLKNNIINNKLPVNSFKKLSKRELLGFTGNYWGVKSHITRKIIINNDTLKYYRSPRSKSALLPITDKSFSMITWGNVKVNFNIDSNKKTMDIISGDKISHYVAYNNNVDWMKDLKLFTGNFYASALDKKYSIVYNKGKLTLLTSSLKGIELEPKIKDVFTSNKEHFTSITFKKDLNENIEGFVLSTEGLYDLWFKKEN
jgi:CubicO group peptidase (beta-lactamase class C family)